MHSEVSGRDARQPMSSFPTLDGIMASETLLSTFDIDCIVIDVLLFQTGHLCALESEIRDGIRYYKLGYPNRKVRKSFNVSLLGT